MSVLGIKMRNALMFVLTNHMETHGCYLSYKLLQHESRD